MRRKVSKSCLCGVAFGMAKRLSEIGEMQIRPCESHLPGVPLLYGQLTSFFYINPNTFYRFIKHSKTAGKILRSHVEGNRALIVTNDRLAPLYLDKYEAMMKEGGDIQVGE